MEESTIIPIYALYIAYEIEWGKIAMKQPVLLEFLKEKIGDIIAKYHIVSSKSKSGYELTEVLLGFRSKWLASSDKIINSLDFEGIKPDSFKAVNIAHWEQLIELLHGRNKKIAGTVAVHSNIEDTQTTIGRPMHPTIIPPLTFAQRLAKNLPDAPSDKAPGKPYGIYSERKCDYPKPLVSIPICDDKNFRFYADGVNLEYSGQCRIFDALMMVSTSPIITTYSIMWNVQTSVLYVLLRFNKTIETTNSRMFDIGISGHPKWTPVSTFDHYKNVIRSHQNHSIPIVKDCNDKKIQSLSCSVDGFDEVYKALLPHPPEKTGKSITFLIKDTTRIVYTIHQSSR